MKAETKLRVAACAAGFALPRYNDLPSVGLYLDQTVQFVNGYFRSFCGVELTPSMVSNYVKKGVVDHPIRKKYTRDQIASLMYIAVSKTVLSIENIDTLFKMQQEYCSAGTAYDIFCEELETSLSVVFGGKGGPAGGHAQRRASAAAQHHFCSGQQNISGLLLRCLAAGAGSVVGYPAGSGVTE